MDWGTPEHRYTTGIQENGVGCGMHTQTNQLNNWSLISNERSPSAASINQQKYYWIWAVTAALLSGCLMAGCYWPLSLHLMAWITLVPWFVVLPKRSPGYAWLYGTLLGLVFYRIGLAWMFGVHGPLGGIAIVGLALWMGYSFRIARMLMERFGTQAMIWALPLCFVGQEILRCEGLARYRFAYLGWVTASGITYGLHKSLQSAVCIW